MNNKQTVYIPVSVEDEEKPHGGFVMCITKDGEMKEVFYNHHNDKYTPDYKRCTIVAWLKKLEDVYVLTEEELNDVKHEAHNTIIT